MLFADNIILVVENKTKVQSGLVEWQQSLESFGLKISRIRTKYMLCNFGGPFSSEVIKLDDTIIPVYPDFRFLGSLLQSDGELDRTVKHRINLRWMKWRQVMATRCDSRISFKLKEKIYKSIFQPVVLYGLECWTTKVIDERRLYVAERRMVRCMCGTRMHKIKNDYFSGCMKKAPVIKKLKSNRSSWHGHVIRRNDKHILKKVLEMELIGYKGRGKPKKTWMDCVRNDTP
ncbi:uncharacterized protein LOC113512247 [Galleria mellonella]|uniref:Uncharacterized protein LOC113512247 n=1 Tax=Galleria mellonella TaxID=7137 RepID=A0A6J1WDZ5_GALME|nr:uncharacterized protein LOC113512247 [Galleria mellonella]